MMVSDDDKLCAIKNLLAHGEVLGARELLERIDRIVNEDRVQAT